MIFVVAKNLKNSIKDTNNGGTQWQHHIVAFLGFYEVFVCRFYEEFVYQKTLKKAPLMVGTFYIPLISP